MTNQEKYSGVIPAFYACYDQAGNVDVEAIKQLTQHYIDKGVQGLYVAGSSGECIYLSVEERKQTLEAVMSVAKDKIRIIAHVACNNTKDSMELAAHAESLGVDAIAAIPPIYFKLPDHAIAAYWNDISSAAPNTDFVIYNIPQLAGVALSTSLLKEMCKNPRVVGVKNSSMPVQDIEMFLQNATSDDFVVFNGPDEQFISGLAMGACGGIGGTYGVMPELFLTMFDLIKQGKIEEARSIQFDVNNIIYKMVSTPCNMYAVAKEVIRINEGLTLGDVRKPLAGLTEEGKKAASEAASMIKEAINKYCK